MKELRLVALIVAASFIVTVGLERQTQDSSTYQQEAAACAAEAFPSTGTIYYICDCGTGASASCAGNAGNDANNGTSKATPWQHYAKVTQFNSIAAGDTIAFCKGGAFNEASSPQLANTSTTAASPGIIREYAPTWGLGAGEATPRINVCSGCDGLFFNGPTNPVVHHEGVKIRNLDFEGGGIAGRALHFANGISNVDVCNVTMNDCDTAVEVGNSQSLASPPGTNNVNSQQHDYYFHGDTFTNNNSEAGLGGAINLWVQYNYMNGNSHASSLSHGGWYFSQATDCISGSCPMLADNTAYTATGERYWYNIVTNSGRASDSSGVCGQSQVVVHGLHDGMSMIGNSLYQGAGTINLGCYGIQWSNGDPYAEIFSNGNISGNTIVNASSAIDVSSTTFTTIANNTILGNDANSIIGIQVGRVPPSGGDANSTNDTVVNDTCWYTTSHNASYPCVQVGGQGSGYVIANNTNTMATAGGVTCFVYDLTASSYSAYAFIDNNNCNNVSGTLAFESDAPGGTAKSLATWKAATSFDAHSLTVAPSFTTTGIGTVSSAGISGIDYRPQAGSGLLGAGTATYAPTLDGNGVTRPNPPAIGAFELAVAVSAGGKASFFGFGAP